MSSIPRDLLPHSKVFYERELGRLTRPDRRGWAKGNCPFHKSKSGRSFSVNLINGAFTCFNCGAKGGDVISFVRKRYGLSFPDALKRLGIDVARLDGLTGNAPKTKSRPLTPAARLALAVLLPHEYIAGQATLGLPHPAPPTAEHIERMTVRDMVHCIARIKQETSVDLRVYVNAHNDEAEKLWGLLAAATEALDFYETDYMQLAGLEVTR